jgi:hypothetical protein
MTVVRVIQIREDAAAGDGSTFLRMAERVSGIFCDEHFTSATLMTVFRSKAGISGCCNHLLDRVERELCKE